MSKMMLVIDEPGCCADCPCSFFERSNPKLNLICGIEQEDANNVGIPDWCPLRPVPEKLPEKYDNMAKDDKGGYVVVGSMVDSVAIGYNRCIDDITKENGRT